MPEFNGFQNGRSRGKEDQNGFYEIVNADIHKEPGRISAQDALISDTSTNYPTEASVQAVSPSGTIYYFSITTTKIWKRTSAGVFSSITANSNSGGHRGARYYNGYIYYWTASKLGRFVVETEASRNDSFGTFSNGNAYGSCEENLTLYIEDGKYTASVNSNSTFQANALDLPAQFIGTSVIPDGNTNILIGTIINSNVQECRGFLWDTYSDSYSLSDSIPEKGINTFINCDDMILAVCGNLGHLYQWTGGQFAIFDNELRDETTSLGHQLSCVFNGRPLIAVGNKIYSIYRRFSGSPRAICREYTATATITSLEVSGSFLSVSVTAGLNKIGTSKSTGYVETPVIYGQPTGVEVTYITGGEYITIATNSDESGYVTQTPIVDSIRKKVYFDGGIVDTANFMAKIGFSNTAVISNISIL